MRYLPNLRVMAFAASALCASLCLTPADAASVNNTLQVSATVTAACAFGGTMNVSFSNVAALSQTSDQSQRAVATLACTVGTTPSLSLASSPMLQGTNQPNNTLPFSLTFDDMPDSPLSSSPQTIPNYVATGGNVKICLIAKVLASDFGHMQPDQYTQVVTLQVNY